MAKFSGTQVTRSGRTPAEVIGRTVTFEGAPAAILDVRTSLYLTAVSSLVEDAFYESASTQMARVRTCVQTLVREGDSDWVYLFVNWLRNTANIRSMAIVVACEYAAAGGENSRRVIDVACQRADEPAEVLGYWWANIQAPVKTAVKRGLADAVRRLYTEYSALKYDGQSRDVRMADVLNIIHAKPASPEQDALFRWLLDRRHGHVATPENVLAQLPMVQADQWLMSLPEGADRRAIAFHTEALSDAGWTWERLSGWLPGGMDASAWTAVIPQMPYMACLSGDTDILLADGTSTSLREIVERRLPVLAPSRPFDTSEVRYGPSQSSRNRTMGEIIPVLPSAWHSMGERPVVDITLRSGRSITATLDHRWVKRRRGDRRESWEWVTTADLQVGDKLPVPNGIEAWGEKGDGWDGYFVGAMLGDGCMTNHGTPEFSQISKDDREDIFSFMEDYASKFGCLFTRSGDRKWRFTFPAVRKLNPLKDLLVDYGVWGLKANEKQFANQPYSKAFWIGAISGLIDTDGHVRRRHNQKGTEHGSIEYATVSRTMAHQVLGTLQRLGIQATLNSRRPGDIGNYDIYIVSVNKAGAIKRAAEVLTLRHTQKRQALADLADLLPDTPYENVEHDSIVDISDVYVDEVYCVTVDESSSFVANGVVTGNCLRNLRNFLEAGVSDELYEQVLEGLADPEAVAKSRQFPYRFYSAAKATGSLDPYRTGMYLDKALQASTRNIPVVNGRSLVLVDTSGSMSQTISDKSDIRCYEIAGVLGASFAARNGANAVTYVEFASDSGEYEVNRSPLALARETGGRNGRHGHGTDVAGAIERHYKSHNRVIIVTDGQYMQGLPSVVRDVPVYEYRLGGYAQTATKVDEGGKHHVFGGFSDAHFRFIPMLERGRNISWDDLFAQSN